MDIAVLYNADTIVFEHLDKNGKVRGSKKQKLKMWRSQEVQSIVANKAHRLGMRISHVCAWGTSKYAYDGSGIVLRGKAGGFNTYELCKFQNGKTYNCDLSASYNIGARYFIREILKSLDESSRLAIEAKVPQFAKRSTCTFSTLISLNAELMSLAAQVSEFQLYGRNAVHLPKVDAAIRLLQEARDFSRVRLHYEDLSGFQIDNSCRNINQLMRLPVAGSFNTHAQTYVSWSDRPDARNYSIDEMMERLGIEKTWKKPSRQAWFLSTATRQAPAREYAGGDIRLNISVVCRKGIYVWANSSGEPFGLLPA